MRIHRCYINNTPYPAYPGDFVPTVMSLEKRERGKEEGRKGEGGEERDREKEREHANMTKV